MLTAWTPTGAQVPALVVLAALMLLGVTILVTAFADARADHAVDDRIRGRYVWTGRAD